LTGVPEFAVDGKVDLGFPEEQVFGACYSHLFGRTLTEHVVFISRIAAFIEISHEFLLLLLEGQSGIGGLVLEVEKGELSI
jgi:hypothetical protein